MQVSDRNRKLPILNNMGSCSEHTISEIAVSYLINIMSHESVYVDFCLRPKCWEYTLHGN